MLAKIDPITSACVYLKDVIVVTLIDASKNMQTENLHSRIILISCYQNNNGITKSPNTIRYLGDVRNKTLSFKVRNVL